MTEIDPGEWVEVVELVPGGEKVIGDGPFFEIIVRLDRGEFGEPGALGLRVPGHPGLIFSRRLIKLIAETMPAAARESERG